MKSKDIPQLEYVKANKKEIIWSFLSIFIYIIIKDTAILRYFFPINGSLTKVLIISLVSDIIILFVGVYALKDRLKSNLKIFKENHKKYRKYLKTRFIWFFIIYFIVSAICVKLSENAQQSVNQQVLNKLPIWFLIIDSVILGPILEEIIYRGVPRIFIKNKIIFVLMSAIIFGAAHVIFEENIKIAIINMIPYSVMGGFFAYIYADTENIANNMFCHIIYNSIVVFFMIAAGKV